MSSRRHLAAPFLAAAALAYILDLGALSLGAALGVAAFAALLLAGRPASARLGALALAGAFSLGLSAAIFSALLGQSVRDMAATASSPVGVTLAVGALMLGVFGLLCLAWALLAPSARGD
ncbi:MAG: hypothetical protein MUF32_01165 [Burkholderiaceae bacterium]|jgi:hypothetical protein|nr:hypothetical protein [Burkholderiaceae bacterium]